MTFNSLVRQVEEMFPDSEVCTDNDGQLVIYTGMTRSLWSNGGVEGGTVVRFEPEDEMLTKEVHENLTKECNKATDRLVAEVLGDPYLEGLRSRRE